MRLSVIARIALLSFALPVFAEPMVGLTSTGALVNFDSATPGTFTSGPTAITGLTAGYNVVSIDRRPATGQLHALAFNFAVVGNEMQFYLVNETTGAATLLSTFAAPRSVGSTLNAATRFSLDINAVSDVARVNSTGRDNFRINPSTGALAGDDVILTPAGTQLAGSAYSNNVAGATSATLYAIDLSTSQLVIIGGNPVPPGASPNGGVATVVGPLGVGAAGELGFEITPAGTALAAMTVGGVSGLYTVNLATGAATLVGPFQGLTTLNGLTSAIPPAVVSGTKTAPAGPYAVGNNVTYTVTLNNTGLGPQADNPGDEFIDVLPATLQLVSANATSGTSVANVGTNTVTWNGAIAAAGSVTITITATILPAAAGTTVNNQGTINFDADGNGTNETSTPTDDPGVGGAADPTSITVSPLPAAVSGTKTVSAGPYAVGSAVTYTITVTNGGLGPQADNPGDEFIDVLPATLQLVSANATAGTAVANIGTNTVTWNGALAPAASVTITITATILPAAAGTTVSNQGTINYDADGNGTNESTAQTDDPGVGGAADPTSIGIAALAVGATAIPTLSPFALLLMCLAMVGVVRLRRVS